MAQDAGLSKTCPSGLIYLVPGRMKVRPEGAFFDPPTDEIIVDIMPTGAEFVRFRKPTVKMTLLGPAECVFEKPNVNEPNNLHYTLSSDKTQIQAVHMKLAEPDKVYEINRNNSLSYWFPIVGRDGREVKLKIVVTGEPVQVVADSCEWTVEGLAYDTTNLGGRPFDAV